MATKTGATWKPELLPTPTDLNISHYQSLRRQERKDGEKKETLGNQMNLWLVTKNKLVTPVQVGSPTSFLGITIISLDIRSNRDDITTAMSFQKIERISEYKEAVMLRRDQQESKSRVQSQNLSCCEAEIPRRVHSLAFRFSNLHSLTMYSVVCRVSWWIAIYYWCSCSFLD